MPELHTLITNLALGESPRWHADRLWLSEWVAHEVLAVALAGKREVITTIPSFPFCIDFLPDGGLLVVSHQLLLRRKPDGSLVSYADLTSLSPYGWNEIVVDGRGNVYVNNIGFDFPGGEFAPGIIALVTPDGSARQVAADGSLSNQRVWADLDGGSPDGICLDAEHAVWYADVPNKRCVRVREGGEVLQTIELDRGCFACALGGANKSTLFMIATEWHGTTSMADGARTGQVLTVEAPAPGAGWL